MKSRVGRMISLEVGVADEAAGRDIAALMMGESAPKPGSERAVADGSVLSYLRAFKVLESAERTEPAVWVDFGIKYDNNAEADPIVRWLLDTLKKHESTITLRVDTSEIPIEMEAMTELIRKKVEKSV
ncbi:hypothetical protein KJ567_00375 [Candidatus Bipolaricaulota bacterium]|nr:hypothetical protein [Candidatus Bipolaricaulota bacterium]